MAKQKKEYYPGDAYYGYFNAIAQDRVPKEYLPKSSLAYITYLLTEKFKRKFSFQEVEKLLNETFPVGLHKSPQ